MSRKLNNMENNTHAIVDLLKNKIYVEYIDVESSVILRSLNKNLRVELKNSKVFDDYEEIINACYEGNDKKARCLFNLCSKEKQQEYRYKFNEDFVKEMLADNVINGDILQFIIDVNDNFDINFLRHPNQRLLIMNNKNVSVMETILRNIDYNDYCIFRFFDYHLSKNVTKFWYPLLKKYCKDSHRYFKEAVNKWKYDIELFDCVITHGTSHIEYFDINDFLNELKNSFVMDFKVIIHILKDVCSNLDNMYLEIEYPEITKLFVNLFNVSLKPNDIYPTVLKYLLSDRVLPLYEKDLDFDKVEQWYRDSPFKYYDEMKKLKSVLVRNGCVFKSDENNDTIPMFGIRSMYWGAITGLTFNDRPIAVNGFKVRIDGRCVNPFEGEIVRAKHYFQNDDGKYVDNDGKNVSVNGEYIDAYIFDNDDYLDAFYDHHGIENIDDYFDMFEEI